MDLRQLEIIRAIADTGSFTAAGEKLHVSQSAISRQILLLEEELGEPVFHRIGRRIRITPAGESLLQLSHRVFQDLQDTVATISDTRESLKGTIRLVGGMTVCLYVFPTLLAEVRRVHPHLDMKVTVGSAERSIAMLRAGAGDLGLLTLPVEAADLISVPVLREELLLVTYPTHPLAKKKHDRAGRSGSAAVRAVRDRIDHAPDRRGILRSRANRARHHHGDRERGDHQGDGPERARHQHHPVAGRGSRREEQAAVLQPGERRLARASDGLALSEDEPAPASGVGSDERVRDGAAAPSGDDAAFVESGFSRTDRSG